MSIRNLRLSVPGGILLFAAAAGLLIEATLEFYNVSWGTGKMWGEFSLKWGLLFFLFVVFCIFCLLATGFVLWGKQKTEPFLKRLAILRGRIGRLRWLAVLAALIFPIWFFQYSPWGVAFNKPFMRILIWCIDILIMAFFLSQASEKAVEWRGVLIGSLLCGAGFVITNSFGTVTSYPFSLGWSEGNRLWDYSLLFGMHLYEYSAGNPPSAYLDFGRQLVGGLPFLLPQVSLGVERFWIALMEILPYLLLGWLAFRPSERTGNLSWILAGVWGLMFLNQGPIHAPLLVCAILVAIAWRRPLWAAVPLVAIAGYFAQLSRFTYIFAPTMWAVMLEFGGAVLDKDRIRPRDWGRAVSVGIAGLSGAALSLRFIPQINNNILIPAANEIGTPVVNGVARAIETPVVNGVARAIETPVVNGAAGVIGTFIPSAATSQPLLWYRLFPNATYGYGILIGLLIAVGPVMVILFSLAAKDWKLNLLQKLSILLPMSAFLVVGLIVSTKIGGGGDLHNMDMFLIALMFSAALAWRAKGAEWVAALDRETAWMQAVVLLLIVIPAFQPLMALRPLSFAKDAEWLAVLADVQKPKDLGSLPSDSAITSNLQELRAAVKTAQSQGEVLFMDQRQLLTFGYIKDVPLVSEYEKKLMMDEALSSSTEYFQPFYADLAAHRFSLIISDPLRTPIKDSEYGFGEENNAWVKWIAKPVLCYYAEKDTLMDIRVEMLVPREGSYDCSTILP